MDGNFNMENLYVFAEKALRSKVEFSRLDDILLIEDLDCDEEHQKMKI